jgi:hypothetical protein
MENTTVIKPVIAEESGTLFTMGYADKVKPAISPVEEIIGNNIYVDWGNDDNYLPDLYLQSRKSNIIPTAAAKKANTIYGSGLNFGTVDYGDDDKLIRQSMYKERADIRLWLKRMNAFAYRQMAATELAWNENLFVQGIMGFTGKIERMLVISSRKCRLGIADENGLVKSVFVSADFSKRSVIEEIPLIDMLFDPIGQLRALKGKRFMIHLRMHAPDLDHYGLPVFDSAIRSKLLPYQAHIINFKISLTENQLKVAQILYIAEWYMRWKYPDWDEKPTLQQARFKETADAIEKKITNTENAGVALMALTKEIQVQKGVETRDPFRLVAVDRPKINELLNEDLDSVNANLFIATGMDATLLVSTGKTLGEGSGSNKRVAQNNMGIDATPMQDIMLQPLNLALQFNFAEDIECWLMQPYIATLDTGTEVETKSQ